MDKMILSEINNSCLVVNMNSNFRFSRFVFPFTVERSRSENVYHNLYFINNYNLIRNIYQK